KALASMNCVSRLGSRASHMIANPPMVFESVGAILTLFCAGDAPKQKPPDLQGKKLGSGLIPSGPIGSKEAEVGGRQPPSENGYLVRRKAVFWVVLTPKRIVGNGEFRPLLGPTGGQGHADSEVCFCEHLCVREGERHRISRRGARIARASRRIDGLK